MSLPANPIFMSGIIHPLHTTYLFTFRRSGDNKLVLLWLPGYCPFSCKAFFKGFSHVH